MEKYVYVQTYGCSANQNNSEIIKGVFRQAGYEITNNEEIAEIIVINTCVVKQKTENKIERKIQDIAEKYPGKILIVAGCMPETDAKQIKKLSPKAVLLGTHHLRDILNLVDKHKKMQLNSEKQKEFLDYGYEEKVNLPKMPENKLISIIQISEGCFGNCSFCKTRLAKGKLFSYSQAKILSSVENDLKNRAKEIWITSQDNANYGMDRGERQLPELLNSILKLKHNFKLRLGMMNPNNVFPILDRMIEIYKDKKMYKFLHIPIQSASDKVLASMNRVYRIKDAKKIIEKFKQTFPDLTLATDIIAGYPAESESSHQENLKFIETFCPDVLNISKFSSHKKTPAGKLKQLNTKIIKRRTAELMEMHRKTALENKTKFLNKTMRVFVDRKIGGSLYESRDDNYSIILINTKDKIFGKNVKVRIMRTGVHYMFGSLENSKN